MSFFTALLLLVTGGAAALLLAWWREWPSRPRSRRDLGKTDGGGHLDEPGRLGPVSLAVPEAIAVLDRDGLVIETNPAFRRLFSVETESLDLGLSGLTGHRELALLADDALADGGTHRLELDIDGDGDGDGDGGGDGRPRSRHLIVSCTALGEGGAAMTARDITDSILMGQIRHDLVANVSHEIKTPLTAIRGFAETLRDGALDEPETAIRFTHRIIQQCDRLQALLADLLTLSRIKRSETPTESQIVRLDEIVVEAVETLLPTARERRVALAAQVDGEPTLQGDPEALSELCLNLIDNAIKYNEEGGKVDVRLATGDGEILLEVVDTGRGIPEASLPRIFERFYRVDRGRGRKEGGTGLGLAIAQHAAELHGGRIEVESHLGRGSTFRVFLPTT